MTWFEEYCYSCDDSIDAADFSDTNCKLCGQGPFCGDCLESHDEEHDR